MNKTISLRYIKAAIAVFMAALTCFSVIPFFKIEVSGAQDEMDIKVFDYNICAYVDPGNIDRMFEKFPSRTMADYSFDKRAVRLKKLIDRYAPDVITLQEVNYEWFPYLTENANTRLTDKYAYIGVSANGNRDGSNRERWDLYNLIFYNTEKFELLKSGDFWLSTTPDVPSRNTTASSCFNRTCTWAILRDKKTGIAYFQANTHLTTCTEEYSVHQAQVICQQIEKLSMDLPVIITGDMNMSTTMNGRTYGCFTGYGYADARFEAETTKTASTWRSFGYYPTRFLSNTIDHLFVKGNIQMELYKNLTESFDANYNIIDDYDSIIANGEKYGYDLSDHIGIYFEGTVRNDFDVWDGKTPTSAPETFVKEGNTYYLNGADALAYFARTVNNGQPYIDCDIILTTDVNLLGFLWTKIGGTDGINNPFRGRFNGNGNVVHHLNIDENTERSGFFGYVSVAKIQNFGIESGSVRSVDWAVGSICGIATSETVIENCYSKADVIGYRGGIGGILGATWNVCTVRNCYYTGNISCTRSNGLSGGSVTIGGIVGFSSASYGSGQRVNVNGCYYAGKNSLGVNDDVNKIYTGAIFSTVATPSNSEPTSTLTVDVSGCLYPEGSALSASDSKRTNKDMQTGFIYVGTHSNDFQKLNYLDGYTDDIYCTNGYYPVLKWQCEKPAVISNDGTNYYIVEEDELFAFAYDVNTGKNTYNGCNVYLISDMDLENERFTSIGGWDGSEKYVFNGSFNGLGHTVNDLYISSSNDKAGFFGCVGANAVIENVGISSGSVKGRYSVGALIGYMKNGARLKKSFSRADVFGVTDVGGAVGSAQASTIEDVYVNAYVSGVSYGQALISGGILGKAVDGGNASELHITRSYYGNDYIMTLNSLAASGEYKGYYVGEIAGGASSDKIKVVLDHCASLYTSKNLSSKITNSSQISNVFLSTGTSSIASDKLNSGSFSAYIKDSSNINKKYPILYWQANGESQKMTDDIISKSNCVYVVFDSITVAKGESVTIGVNIKNNNGISGISFDIVTDGRFELESVQSPYFSVNGNSPYDVSLSGSTTDDYTVAYLTFKTDTAEPGEYSFTLDNITVTNDSGNVASFAEISSIGIIDCVMGDANSDNMVNTKDIIRIKKYVSDPSTQINAFAADIDKDGKVDEKDVSAVLSMIVG